MIHWFVFNFIVIAVALSLVFEIHNELTVLLGWVLLIIAVILVIKDLVTVRG